MYEKMSSLIRIAKHSESPAAIEVPIPGMQAGRMELHAPELGAADHGQPRAGATGVGGELDSVPDTQASPESVTSIFRETPTLHMLCPKHRLCILT